jgi:uroporphyrinogen decarboxylase
VAIDNSVDPAWAAEHVQPDGCVQGNLATPEHMVTGGQALVDDTRSIVEAAYLLERDPHIFNLGHGITPDADPGKTCTAAGP